MNRRDAAGAMMRTAKLFVISPRAKTFNVQLSTLNIQLSTAAVAQR
jgi:hypothetical protein